MEVANNAEFTMVFKIREDGSLILAEKNIKKAGKAVSDLGAAQKAAGKASDEHNYKLNQGAAATASAGRNMSKLAQTIGSGPNGLVGAYATLAANAFAVSAAFSALKSAAQAEQLLQGLEAQGARTGHTLSTVSNTIMQISESTLSASEAMRATAQASAAGISTTDLEKMTQVATNASKALGRDVPDSINRMILAVTKMEPELVDELGLTTKMTEASERYARQIGKTASSLSQMEKQQALLNAWTAQGEQKFSAMKDAVDPNVYSRLAASFDTLVKSTGSLINNMGVATFIEHLADSTTALLGVTLLFGSTIKGSLLPGLLSSAKVAKSVSDDRLQELKTQRAQISLIREETLARKENELAKLKQSLTSGTPSPRVYKEWVDAVRNGENATDKAAAALKSLNISIGQNEALQRKALKSNDQDKASGIAARIEDREKEKKALESYGATAAQIQSQINEADKESAKLAREATTTRLEGKAQEQRAIAITSLKQGELVASITAVRASTRLYYLSLKSAALGLAELGAETSRATLQLGLLQKVMIGAKAGAFGLVTAVKSIGVAILEWLPYIGLAVIAWDAILWVVDKLTPDSVKRLQKAHEEFNVVLDNTNDKIKGMEQIQNSVGTVSEKAIAYLQNQSATVYELADAYIKLREEAKKTQQETAPKDETAKFEVFRSSLASSAGKQNSSTSSSATEAFKSVKNVSKESVSDISDAIKMLESLERANPPLAAAFYKSAKAIGTTGELLSLLDEYSYATAESLKKLEKATKGLDNSIKDINTGYPDFMKSLSVTTPFDAALDKFRAFTNQTTYLKDAIAELPKGAQAGALEEYSKAITGITGSSRNIFSVSLQVKLEGLDTANLEIESLKNSLAKLSAKDPARVSTAKALEEAEASRASILSKVGPEIESQTKAYEIKLQKAKLENILNQSAISLAQAKLSLLQRQGVITGQDAVTQMKAQDRILSLQQNELKTKQEFLRIDLQRRKEELESISNELKKLESLRLQTAEYEAHRRLNLQMAEDSAKASNDIARATNYRQQLDIMNKQAEAREKERIDLERRKETLGRDTEVAAAQISALDAQISALSMSMSSAAERNAAYMKKELDNQKESRGIQLDIIGLNKTRLQAQREIISILNLGDNALKNENKAIRENAELAIVAAETEFHFKSSLLKVEIALAKARGNSSQVDYYSNLLDLAQQTNRANIANIQNQSTVDILNKNAIKDTETYYSKLQDIYNTDLKIVEAKREASSAQLALNEASLDLEAKRRGVTDTEATQRIKQIQAAKANLENINAEVLIKQRLITLEFALLKAKREQSLRDAKDSQAALEKQKDTVTKQLASAKLSAQAEKKNRGDEPSKVVNGAIEAVGNTKSAAELEVDRLEQILAGLSVSAANWTPIINSLDSSNGFEEAATLLKDALAKGSETAAKNLELAMERGPLVKDGLMSQKANMGERQTARETSKVSEKAGLEVSATVLEEMDTYTTRIKDSLTALGPEGEIVLAAASAAQTIGSSFVDAFRMIGDASASSSDKTVASLQLVSAVISGVASILKSTSNAKISQIDKEIAAEEKRDGKSAASLEKIKGMQKKKDDTARKSFNIQKKLMMAQAVVSTAAGIAMALGELGPIAGPIMAGVIGAMGMAQIAIISGTQYESALTNASVSTPSTLSIGKRSDTVDLAKGPNANAGGEAGYLRGSAGSGSDASNYRTVGSAYGGELMRGYGNRGFVVGEKGPEVITPDTPISVTPTGESSDSQPITAHFNIQALDSSDVQRVLVEQKGNIIKMLRQAANASGKTFMENVNVNVYSRPGTGKL